MQHYLHMVQITLQHEIQQNILELSIRYSFSWMSYWEPDGKIIAGPKSRLLLLHPALHVVAEGDGAGRVTERQPGMSRETTDRERSVLFVQVCVYVCVCVCVCVSASSTLPAREWLWDWNVVPVRAFFKIRNTLALQTNWRYFCSQLCFVLVLLASSIPGLYQNCSHCFRCFPTF